MRVYVILGAVACGDPAADGPADPDAFPPACDQSMVDGDCVLFTGDGWVAEDVGDACPTGLISAICPPGALGDCTVDAGNPFETVTSFYPAFWTAASASVTCSSAGGDWTER